MKDKEIKDGDMGEPTTCGSVLHPELCKCADKVTLSREQRLEMALRDVLTTFRKAQGSKVDIQEEQLEAWEASLT